MLTPRRLILRTLRNAAMFGAAFILLAGLFAPRIVAAQEVTPVFVVSRDPVAAGGPLSVWLAVLNASGRAVTYSFPASLDGRLRASGVDRSVAATLRNASEAGEAAIAPGAYVRREYVIQVPAGLEGQAVLSVPSIAANAVAVDVRQAEVVAKAAETPPAAPGKGPGEPPKAPAEGDEGSAAAFFKEHVSGYEPFYFIAGPEYPTARFQISFKYQLFSSTGEVARAFPAIRGLHLAYTQSSLWDLDSTSKPFVDTSYKPEVFYAMRRVDGGRVADWLRLDLQAGFQHESNGKSGADSRSLNIAYLEPKVVLGSEDRFHFSLAPRAWVYVGGLDENPAIKNFRGYAGLRSTLGWGNGLLLMATGRLGDDANRGSLQLDLSYPLFRVLYGNLGLYLYTQYFGESLLRYNERTSVFRAGFALYR
jgi:phospholipase A1/A2